MGINRDYRKRQHKAAEQEAKRRAPTSPDDPNAKNLDVWQPERLTLKNGIKSASWPLRILYLLIIISTAVLNVYAGTVFPEEFSMLNWFGYNSFMVNSIFYLFFSFCLILFLIYRDIVNRSVSRKKVFIPMIFCLGNYYIIADQLLLLAA